MSEAFDRALAGISDRAEPDWDVLEAQAPTEHERQLLRSLRDVARIGHQYSIDAEPDARTVPFTWGPLQVLQWIARGAHGEVYRAWDPRLEREVALKLLRTTSAGEREVTAVAEGRLLARVHHPNVVSVYGADRVDGQAGVWMEFLAGRTLREEVESRGTLPLREAVVCAVEVCSALTAIHDAGLIHRDVKAQNIIRTPNRRTVLMDFGAGADSRTRRGAIEGTPVYLAPEVLAGSDASAASEVYAVGVLLFYMLTGRYPAAGASLDEIRRAHASVLPTDRVSGSPPAVAAILNRTLARRPADRFATAEALGSALDQLVQAPRQRRRSRFAAAAAILTFTVIGCIAVTAHSERPAIVQSGPRRMMLPNEYDFGVPSRDGQRYPAIDRLGQLGYWEASGGATHVVLPAPADAALGSPALSPDGSRIAYTVALRDGSHELRITDIARRETRAVILRETAYEPIIEDWSADNASLLCWFRQKAGALDLALVSIDTGDARPLYTVTGGQPPHAALSPDSRFVITLQPGEQDENDWSDFVRTGQLLLVPVDGSPPRPLLRDAAASAFPSWLPDGHAIFFLRPSTTVKYSHDGWIARLDPGMHVEAAGIVEPNIGSVERHSAYLINSAGELQAMQSTRAAEIYVASFDPGAGRVAAPRRIDPREIGNHVGPAWSPDGGSIAYFSTVAAPFSGGVPLKTLTVKDIQTGRIRRLRSPLAFLGGYTPQWTRDSSAVVVWGRDSNDIRRTGYYKVDVLSGETRPFVIDNVDAPARSQFAPDGRHFLYNDGRTGIVSLDLLTGARRLLLPIGTLGGVGRFALSPDGSTIAFIAGVADGDRWMSALAILRQQMVTPIVRVSWPESIDLEGWTADSRSVLYARGASGETNPVFAIPPEGGAPRAIGLAVHFLPNTLAVSPAGEHVAYAEALWRLELRIEPLPQSAPAGH
jgi:eukaryotic-like serine/threonine-protein kinase